MDGSAANEIVLSVMRIAAVFLRYRRRILLTALAGAAIAAAIGLTKHRVYTALASFVPQGSSDNSGLRTLAGQFGIPVPSGGGGQSPDFYAALVTSPLILGPIAADSFATTEGDQRKELFSNLVDVNTTIPDLRAEMAERKLEKLVVVEADKKAGVIKVRVTTRWRAVSLAIASRILQGVNDFNLHTRQSQAAAERRFTEQRIALAHDGLRAAENELQRFLEGNRQTGAPRIQFEMDRLQREVALQQQMVLTLSQALEDARLREVRDTPVITVIQNATVGVLPDKRGLGLLTVLGLLAGAAFGTLLAFASDFTRMTRTEQHPEAVSFYGALADTLQPFRWLRPTRSKQK